ncbi:MULTISPECIES: acyltransferase [unclassified Aminobacter]|uniref:acyltransferase family protein n=1 Tax=Aminobacter sp. J15 TaxID=935260 RepID=UPI0005524F37|nr:MULTISPECIES: acyltransferase [unclassified Aminobacter]
MIFRVLATFAVLVGHSAAFFKGLQFTQWPQVPYMQNIAVVLFFALSGYTIAWVVDRTSAAGLSGFGRFIYDRAARLLIPLIPILAGMGLLEALYFRGEHPLAQYFTVHEFLGNILLLQDIRPWFIPSPDVHPFGLNRPLWTISLEFWVYVIFGCFAYATRKAPVAQLAALTAIGAVAVLLIADSALGARGAGLPIIWALGMALYHARKGRPNFNGWSKGALLILWAFAASQLFNTALWPERGGYSATYNLLIFGNFSLAMLLLPGITVPTIGIKLAEFFGRFAYTTYLVHYPIMYILRDTGMLARGPVATIIAVLVCLTLSWLISLPFEQRYRNIRDLIWSTALPRRYVKA